MTAYRKFGMALLGLACFFGPGCAEDNEAKLKADIKENGGEVKVLKEAPKIEGRTTPSNYPGRRPN